jgi:hypothetical protein
MEASRQKDGASREGTTILYCTPHPKFDTFDSAKPRFLNRGKKRRFHRQAQDTEFIEVQYQP